MPPTNGDTASPQPRSPSPPQTHRPKSTRGRLSSWFGSKGGHIAHYGIELDEPHRQYGPGDTIKGKVVLHVAKPLGISHITVCLFGYLEIFKHYTKPAQYAPRDRVRVASGKGKRWVSEYYGDGFASLFEDEIVLSGGGRLDPQLYHFRFEIDFPANVSLPSSIDFERGTIAYVLSATITRPTAISPLVQDRRKISYQDVVDVGLIPKPTPHIHSEPGERRAFGSGNFARHLNSTTTGSNPSTDSKVWSRASSQSGDTARASRVPSIDTRETQDTTAPSPKGSRPSSPAAASAVSAWSAPASQARHSEAPSDTALSERSMQPRSSVHTDTSRDSQPAVTVSVELSKAGFLPGEVVPIKITVQQTKFIRSPNGVIVTLFRQSRVDMHPNLPIKVIGSDSKKRGDYDPYPRSRTGLGGLSLSTAGSSQVWRKDLSQSFAPLYIDARTMSAVIKTAVRVPDDAFPSMQNTPGQMITFKYFVEVIVDVHGRLASSGALTAIANGSTSQGASYTTVAVANAQLNPDRDPLPAASGANCIDTSPLRRGKNAFSAQCALTVGTKDSAKARSKRRVNYESDLARSGTAHNTYQNGHDPSGYDAYEDYNPHTQWHHDPYWYDYGYDYGYYTASDGYNYAYNNPEATAWPGYGPGYESAPGYAPPPLNRQTAAHSSLAEKQPPSTAIQSPRVPPPPSDLAGDSAASEKERLRRAEEQLLPSRPPGDDEGASSSADATPSAPYIPEEQDLFSNARNTPTHLNSDPFDAMLPSHPAPSYTPEPESYRSHNATGEAGATLPTRIPHVPTYTPQQEHFADIPVLRVEEAPPPSDDKEELERRRLQQLAGGPPSDATTAPSAPSAPALDEHELSNNKSGLASRQADESAPSAPPEEDMVSPGDSSTLEKE